MHAVTHDEVPSWQHIDQSLERLARNQGEIDAELGGWIIAALRERVHHRFGFGSFEEYLDRRLGFDPKVTRERVRVARALVELPLLSEQLRSGKRSWSAVREIVRVAKKENEAEWVAKTENLTVRQIEALVAKKDRSDPLLKSRRLLFDLAPHEQALLAEAAEHVRAELGPGATMKEVLMAMAEKELGKRSETAAGYQVAGGLCIECTKVFQQAGSEMIEVSPTIGECAKCDLDFVGFTTLEEPEDDGAEPFPAHWDPKLRIPRGQVVAAASIVSPKY